MYWSNQSIPDPCNIEFAGSAAFSEPETIAIRDLVQKHEFKSALLIHSFGDMLVYPFNGDASVRVKPEDVSFYDDMKRVFQVSRAGPVSELLKYTTTGEATDYLYGAMGIRAMSLEIGAESDGFTPDIETALSIADANFQRVKYWLYKSGPEISKVNISFTSAADEYSFSIFNSGLSSIAGHVTVASDHCSGTVRTEFNTTGWSNPIELTGCSSPGERAPIICVVEQKLLCRCFPIHEGVAEIPLGLISTYSAHPRLCEKLGVPTEIVAMTRSPVGWTFPRFNVIGGAIALVLCVLLLMRSLRSTFIRQ